MHSLGWVQIGKLQSLLEAFFWPTTAHFLDTAAQTGSVLHLQGVAHVSSVTFSCSSSDNTTLLETHNYAP